MNFPSTRITPVLLSLGGGVAIGVIGALAGRLNGTFFHGLSVAFSGGWSWACFAFLVGAFRRSKVEAAWLASSALTIGVVVYYVCKAVSPDSPIGIDVPVESSGVPWTRIFVWGVMALILGAPLGVLGNLARNPGIVGFPLRLIVPVIAFFETSWRLNIEASAAGPDAEAAWSTIRALAAIAAAVLVGHLAWERRTQRESPGTEV